MKDFQSEYGDAYVEYNCQRVSGTVLIVKTLKEPSDFIAQLMDLNHPVMNSIPTSTPPKIKKVSQN